MQVRTHACALSSADSQWWEFHSEISTLGQTAPVPGMGHLYRLKSGPVCLLPCLADCLSIGILANIAHEECQPLIRQLFPNISNGFVMEPQVGRQVTGCQFAAFGGSGAIFLNPFQNPAPAI